MNLKPIFNLFSPKGKAQALVRQKVSTLIISAVMLSLVMLTVWIQVVLADEPGTMGQPSIEALRNMDPADRKFFNPGYGVMSSGSKEAEALSTGVKNEVDPETNVVYGVVAGESLLLDIYQPVARETPRPAVIVIHGGAGSYGDRSDLSEHAQALATAGYVAFNIEYRLLDGGKNPWPAQLADVQLAVRWVRANAAQYNVDPNRIAALGHSFGGQLAALLGIRDTPDSGDLLLAAYSSRVACVVDIAGSVDPTQPLQDVGAGLDVQLMDGTASEVPARYRDASPLAQVSTETVPFLIFHGGDDEVVPVEEARRLVDALHKVGVTVVHVEYPHATHFYWLNFFNPGGWESVGSETLAFQGRCLHKGLQPGDKIGNMVLSTGPLPFDLTAIPPWPAFCDSNPALKPGDTEGKPGIYTVECTVPPLPKLHIGGGWVSADEKLRDSDWSAQHKELYVNGQLVDQAAFGSVDADVPVQAVPGQDASKVTNVKLRVWNVVLENLTPGQLTLRQVMRFDHTLVQGQATMPAGVYDFTLKITVDAAAAAPQDTPAPVKITR